jgi:uncharacterized protein YegP (UPF0339 family)
MKIEVFQGCLEDRWYWHLRAPNGRIVADGAEGYASKRNAIRAVRRVENFIAGTSRPIKIVVL